MNYLIGQEIKPLEIQIDKYRPYYYAGASGDYNTIHIDNEYAKKVGLPGVILQGLCTMAYVYRAVVGGEDPGKLKSFKVRFSGVVKPLDRLLITGRVNEIKDGFACIGINVENQKGEQVITNASAKLQT